MKTFYYHGDTPTMHPQLQLIQPGANEIPDDLIDVAEECVEAGLLSHSAHHAPSRAIRSPRASQPDPAPEEAKVSQEPNA